jgi:hypothetical protein
MRAGQSRKVSGGTTPLLIWNLGLDQFGQEDDRVHLLLLPFNKSAALIHPSRERVANPLEEMNHMNKLILSVTFPAVVLMFLTSCASDKAEPVATTTTTTHTTTTRPTAPASTTTTETTRSY